MNEEEKTNWPAVVQNLGLGLLMVILILGALYMLVVL